MPDLNILQQAKLLFVSGQLRKSILVFNQAEKKGENLEEICMSRGAAYLALGRFGEAEGDFCRLLERDTSNERAFYYRGVARVGLGKFSSAIKDLTLSLVQNHDRGIAHLLRGLAYTELGKHGDAELDFNSAQAFSAAEMSSFRQLFGEKHELFENSRGLMARENAPWEKVMSKKTAERLKELLQ